VTTVEAPESERTRAVTVLLAPDVHERLRELAAQHERSMSAEIRFVLRRHCDDGEDPR
jgi:plasmid stability protein